MIDEQVRQDPAQPLRLLDDGVERLALAAIGVGVSRSDGGHAGDRGERRAQIVRHRRQQRAAQLLGLRAQRGIARGGRELQPADRDAGLVRDRFEERVLLRRQRGLAFEPDRDRTVQRNCRELDARDRR